MSIIRDYFLSQEEQLESQYNGSVVAGNTGNTGENRESILRDWLEKHIPKKVTAEFGGKIIDVTGYASDQVDLIIYDGSVPRFGSFPKTYFFAEGVSTAIQVKSKLNSKELKSAVNNLATVKKCQQNFGPGFFLGSPNSGIATGVFAFETGFASSKSVVESLLKIEKQGISPVNFVYINRKCFIAYNPGNWVSMNKDGKPVEPLPKGYNIIENTEGCIWRLVLTVASETKKVVSSTPDFQKYFLQGVLSPSTPR